MKVYVKKSNIAEIKVKSDVIIVRTFNNIFVCKIECLPTIEQANKNDLIVLELAPKRAVYGTRW